jgi:cyclopropane fatty-acyl-phospholipid synthase-like methyltransferase
MMRYMLFAAVLKLSSLMPGLYRLLGNTFGERMRTRHGLDQARVERIQRMLDLGQQYQIQDGDRLLELGTGWLHWEALAVRLFWDVEITLFDVWDNRQFSSLKGHAAELAEVIDNAINMTPEQARRAHNVLDVITSANSFDDIYQTLGLEYVVEPSGSLSGLPEDSYDMVFSFNVMEHVDRAILPDFIKGIRRVMKPAGYSIQWIDISDHISNYAPGTHRKNYLRYSDAVWRSFFENRVQYFNRVQRSEWLSLFQEAGLELIDECSTYTSIDSLRVSSHLKHLSQQDIECLSLEVVHRKPA